VRRPLEDGIEQNVDVHEDAFQRYFRSRYLRVGLRVFQFGPKTSQNRGKFFVVLYGPPDYKGEDLLDQA
jgi:hypothetical protein